MHNKTARENCTRELHERTARENCTRKLHERTARENCTRELRERTARQNCTRELHEMNCTRECLLLQVWQNVFFVVSVQIWFLKLVLTLYCLNFVFRRFLRCSPRWAPIVYKLVGAALIWIFSIIPSYFLNRNFGLTFLILHTRYLRVKRWAQNQ